ncbi:MAG: ATP-grasp domain-containing protein [Pseudomonadota bacterium]|nr:ATP-grasp domain-containing protein [Pseudomonadota bacterium]
MAVWLLEGQSSQRDLLQAIRPALPADIPLYASHRKCRPEITDCADHAWREPADDAERVQWVLDTAQQHQIKLVWAGRRGQVYEPHRAAFEAAGIDLITGATRLQDLLDLDSKAVFAERCLQAGIPVASGWVVNNGQALAEVVAAQRDQHALCIKPVHGIFGEGFWRLIDDLSPFRCFLNPDDRRVNTQLFIDSYSAQTEPKPMLVMQYLSGTEYSVDMVCEAGQVIAAVARDKRADKTQCLMLEHEVIELARRVVALFGCDGIVNLQSKANAHGQQHVLEINARPSGGIGYTMHTGLNLAAICVLRRLGLPVPAMQTHSPVIVRPLTTSVFINSDSGE